LRSAYIDIARPRLVKFQELPVEVQQILGLRRVRRAGNGGLGFLQQILDDA
jgi:hypothetical protein